MAARKEGLAAAPRVPRSGWRRVVSVDSIDLKVSTSGNERNRTGEMRLEKCVLLVLIQPRLWALYSWRRQLVGGAVTLYARCVMHGRERLWQLWVAPYIMLLYGYGFR